MKSRDIIRYLITGLDFIFSVKNSSCIKRIDEGGGIILVIMRLSSAKIPWNWLLDAGDFRNLQKWWPNAFLGNHRYYAARGNR